MRSGVSLHGVCSAMILRSSSGPIWTRPIPIITSWSILSPARTATSIIPARRATTTMCAVPQTHCAGRTTYPSSPRKARASITPSGRRNRAASLPCAASSAPTLTPSSTKPTPTIPFSCFCDETATRCGAAPIGNTLRSSPPAQSGRSAWTVWARATPKRTLWRDFPSNGTVAWPRQSSPMPSSVIA